MALHQLIDPFTRIKQIVLEPNGIEVGPATCIRTQGAFNQLKSQYNYLVGGAGNGFATYQWSTTSSTFHSQPFRVPSSANLFGNSSVSDLVTWTDKNGAQWDMKIAAMTRSIAGSPQFTCDGGGSPNVMPFAPFDFINLSFVDTGDIALSPNDPEGIYVEVS